MVNVKCIGKVIRKSNSTVKFNFHGKNLKNIDGYASVLKRAGELAETHPANEYEIQIVCKVEKEY
jgi:hypothetical protein